jgi:hypothetical protein
MNKINKYYESHKNDIYIEKLRFVTPTQKGFAIAS